MLLSGFTDRDGRQFLSRSPSLPLLIAADDDDDGAVEQMAWLDAVSDAPRPSRDNPRVRLLFLTDQPGRPARAAETLAADRAKNPQSPLLGRGFVNRLGYIALQAGDPKSAVAILQVNVDGDPTLSNAWDSLGDALLADGQRSTALAAAKKALSLVDSDTCESAGQRALIRDSARQKVDRLEKESNR